MFGGIRFTRPFLLFPNLSVTPFLSHCLLFTISDGGHGNVRIMISMKNIMMTFRLVSIRSIPYSLVQFGSGCLSQKTVLSARGMRTNIITVRLVHKGHQCSQLRLTYYCQICVFVFTLFPCLNAWDGSHYYNFLRHKLFLFIHFVHKFASFDTTHDMTPLWYITGQTLLPLLTLLNLTPCHMRTDAIRSHYKNS